MKLGHVLLSGSNGFLGRVIIRILCPLASSVITLGRAHQDVQVDISNPFRLINEVHTRFDVVIHAAGKAHSVPGTEGEKREFYRVNFDGTKNLCLALEQLDPLPKSFIFISTVAVYGVDQGSKISEGHPLNGNTPYAESKIIAEDWLQHWADENGVKLGILRLPLIAGPNPPGNLGAMINGINTGKYLSIGQANAQKSMVWAEDIARIIPTLAEKGGTYNLTDGHHPTFGELEKGIATALGKRKPTKVPYWMAKGLALTGDVIGSRFPINSDKLQKITSTLTFDDSKARRELGWNPTPVLDKIADMVK